jgi:hypothetical protein
MRINIRRTLLAVLIAGTSLAAALAFRPGSAPAVAADPPAVIRSAKSGPWSAPATWEGGKVPAAGARVQVRTGHEVAYDVRSADVIRAIHVAGTLRFVPDKDTRLDVGLIKVESGEVYSEEGFDCNHARENPSPGVASPGLPSLEVGTPSKPIEAGHTAMIRLHYIDGMNKDSCPAIVSCGGRMDFHGAPLSRTWVKLGGSVKAGDAEVALAEAISGWRVGDRIIITATTRQMKSKKTFKPTLREGAQTEERIIRAIDGNKLQLDKPLDFDHKGDGEYRGEVANLSRNVIVESADPAGVRGHTMYHRHSAGAISYAEFRHLGKEGVLGRYSMHFHLIGDTMRGSYVQGASIWDSGNRWITIHGTNYLVVRDCVGYRSMGHGFFLEDATEAYNVLDRNLAVQAFIAKPLPQQVLPYDKNDGSGFWWANSLNAFTRNVAAECDEYGFFFQATKTDTFNPEQLVLQPDGTKKKVDIRTLPFLRFEDNEIHCQRRHAFNLGGGVPFGEPTVGGVGPDAQHPFVIRNTKIWNVHWAFHPVSPSVMVENMTIDNSEYGLWRAIYKQHAYRGVTIAGTIPQGENFSPTGTRPNEADFPKPLDPVDDLPPVTIITHARRVNESGATGVLIRGTTTDNGTVKRVIVNGTEARALTANFAEWEVTLKGEMPEGLKLSAHAEDAAGNVEKRPHVVPLRNVLR